MVPVEVPASHKVHVEVGHNLPGVRAAVNSEAVSFFGNALLSGNLVGRLDHLSDQRRLGVSHLGERRYVLSRDDEQVDRRNGVDIRESHDVIVLVNDFRRYFAPDNFTENAVRLALYRVQFITRTFFNNLSRPGGLPEEQSSP